KADRNPRQPRANQTPPRTLQALTDVRTCFEPSADSGSQKRFSGALHRPRHRRRAGLRRRSRPRQAHRPLAPERLQLALGHHRHSARRCSQRHASLLFAHDRHEPEVAYGFSCRENREGHDFSRAVARQTKSALASEAARLDSKTPKLSYLRMDPIAWLLESDAAVRWQAMRDLTDASPTEIA